MPLTAPTPRWRSAARAFSRSAPPGRGASARSAGHACPRWQARLGPAAGAVARGRVPRPPGAGPTENTEPSVGDAQLWHRERGLRLAVDVAGAGYASFSHVLRLRPDIKLDARWWPTSRSTVRAALSSPAIVVLALERQAQVTAEGVETTSQLDVLRCLGVDAVQGHLLARPTLDRTRIQAWWTRDSLIHTGLPALHRAVSRP